MKMRKTATRILCAMIAALMLSSYGCTSTPVETSVSDTATSSDTGSTDAAEDTEPEQTEEEIVMVEISDKLQMPRITHTAAVKYITSNLNTILKDGYGTKSLQADAFESVFDKLIIFKADRGYYTAYVLGKPYELKAYPLTLETGFYIDLVDINDIFGGEYAYDTSSGAAVSKLVFGDRAIECEDSSAYFVENGEKREITVKKLQRLLDGFDEYTDIHFVNVKDLAALIGINVYYTDTGIVCFSAGEAFDKLRGYYIASEAEKLFMQTEEEKTAFSANMFVDIPNIIKLSENNVTAYSYPSTDLHANVAAYAAQGVQASVKLGPAIVAGQGEADENYTVVRVFDIYQTVHTQFNAYPASVRGGVQVAAAVVDDGVNVLTAPFKAENVTNLRVYDANGSFKFAVSPSGKAPYAIAAGAFLGAEDVFAVTAMYGDGGDTVVEFFSAKTGEHVGDATVKAGSKVQLTMSANRNGTGNEGLILSFGTNAYEYKSGTVSEIKLDGKSYNGIYASAFGGYVATADAEDEYKAFSTVTQIKDGALTVVDTGVKENIFVSTKASSDTEYIKKGVFWHTRVEYPAPVMNVLTADKTSGIRSNDISLFTISPGASEKSKYNTQYNMWEPCSTHRWGKTAQMGYLINYVDPDTGEYAYATLTKSGERNDYLELGSSFYNATYSPFIPALDRLNYWTRRTYLNSLATLYRDAPEYTVAVSPVHEHEIDSGANSVGDYNSKMIRSFADWLEDMYGTVENVNAKYGTDFASFAELDAPRGQKRGQWDNYSTRKKQYAYFTEWTLYNRYIVSRHVIQSYREALLAGFPPELIKAHQIPEGDAVAGLLGEADTRLSPVDIVLADGTGYGGTRYGVWYQDKKSFFALAAGSGQYNITLGEYSAMSTDPKAAFEQLKYMFDTGIVFTHVMTWAGNVAQGDLMDKNEQYAIDELQKLGVPRSASSGGTGDVRAYSDGEVSYNIVEIGTKENSAGLLKSVKEDGSFEGTVYLQPFHAFVGVVDIASDKKASGEGKLEFAMTGKKDAAGADVAGFNYNDTADIRVMAKPTGKNGTLTFKILHEEYEMPVTEYTFNVTGDEREYRYTFKNQVYLADCTVVVEYKNVEITDCDATLLYEMTARKYYGETSPKAHTGGVSFDIMY